MVESGKRARLKTLRDELAAIADPSSWDSVEAWSAKARTLIRQGYPEHLGDFSEVIKTPQWSSSPLFGGMDEDGNWHSNSAEAAAVDRRENQRLAKAAQAKILAFLDGLYEEDPRELPANTTGILIFISHSSKDAELAAALVRCLEAGVDLPDRSIRCTSVPGYKLDPGDNWGNSLRNNLRECKIVLGLVTEESLLSNTVIMELGAAWAFEKRTCAILATSIGFSRVPDLLKQTNVIQINSPPDIAHLVEVVSRDLKRPMRHSARAQAEIQSLIQVADRPATVAPNEEATPAGVNNIHSDEAWSNPRRW
jgi:hypothetical protein